MARNASLRLKGDWDKRDRENLVAGVYRMPGLARPALLRQPNCPFPPVFVFEIVLILFCRWDLRGLVAFSPATLSRASRHKSDRTGVKNTDDFALATRKPSLTHALCRWKEMCGHNYLQNDVVNSMIKTVVAFFSVVLYWLTVSVIVMFTIIIITGSSFMRLTNHCFSWLLRHLWNFQNARSQSDVYNILGELTL